MGFVGAGIAGAAEPWAVGGRAPQCRCASGSLQFALDKWMSGRRGALAGGIGLRGLSLKIGCVLGVLHPRRWRSVTTTFWTCRQGNARKASSGEPAVCSARCANTTHGHGGFLPLYQGRALCRETSLRFIRRPKICF